MIFDKPVMGGRASTNLVLTVKEKALEIVRSRGPLLPVQITKELGVNVLFAGALLSELVDNQSLKISNTKVGGSPMYYVAGQEAKLQSLRDKLNDKQQVAFDMLKQQQILQDSKQEPVIRQSLRDMKDFAIPLKVTAGDMQDIFWKWYLITDAEAEPIIKAQLSITEKKEVKPTTHIPAQIPVKNEVQQQLQDIEQELKNLELRKQKALDEIHRKEEELRVIEKQKPVEQKVKEELKKQELKEIKPKVPRKKAEPKLQPAQIVQQPQPVVEKEQPDETDTFMMSVLDYFKANTILVDEVKQIRRDSDFESVVRIPSVVGTMQYFCKAKNKQKITDADLSLLFVQAQMKKMPILLITTGDLTKKAQDLLMTEFKNITVKKL